MTQSIKHQLNNELFQSDLVQGQRSEELRHKEINIYLRDPDDDTWYPVHYTNIREEELYYAMVGTSPLDWVFLPSMEGVPFMDDGDLLTIGYQGGDECHYDSYVIIQLAEIVCPGQVTPFDHLQSLESTNISTFPISLEGCYV